MFAETLDLSWADLAASRFAAALWLVLFIAGDLQAAWLALWVIRRAFEDGR